MTKFNKFFKEFRNSILPLNATELVSFLKDLLLIILGIFIALQFDNCKNDKQQIEVLQNHLQFVLNDLKNNAILLDTLGKERIKMSIASSDIINSYNEQRDVTAYYFLETYFDLVEEKNLNINRVGLDKFIEMNIDLSVDLYELKKLASEYLQLEHEIDILEKKENSFARNIVRNETSDLYLFYSTEIADLNDPKKSIRLKEKYSFKNFNLNYEHGLYELFLRNKLNVSDILERYKLLERKGYQIQNEICLYLKK